MVTYIAFLRGINSGLNPILKMDVLKGAFEELGFQKEFLLNFQKVFGFLEIPVCLNNNSCHLSWDWFVKRLELQ
jgi:hypothetical protein